MVNGYAAWAARWRVPAGFLLGVAYAVLAQPTPRLLFAGSAVALAGIAIRAYAAGCLDKNKTLAASGPYAHTRNPLYFGSLIMGGGFAVAGGVWYLGLALLALFVLIYWPVMRREEEYLRGQFGEAYAKYAAAVPFFFPLLRPRIPRGEPFTWTQYRKNREYQATIGCVGAVVFLTAKMLLR